MIRKLFTFLGGLILMLLLAVIALPFLFPIENYRDDILKLVQEKTGREVIISGDLNFVLLPNIAVEINEVTVGNPEGFVSSYFAKIGTLKLNMALAPLFSKKFEVDRLAVSKAEVFLEETVGKKKNWEFETAKITKTSTSNIKKEEKSNFGMNIRSLVVEDTKIHYLKPGTKISTEKVNLDYTLNEASLDLYLDHAGTKYKIDLKTPKSQTLFKAEDTPLTLAVRSPLMKADISGKLLGVDLGSGKIEPVLKGILDASITGIGKLNSREFRANKTKANLGLLTAESSKGVSATGDMVVNYAGKKPHINTTLSIPELNLDKLFPAKEEKPQSSLLGISNAYASEGWSRDNIDLSGLLTVDADAKLNVETLISSGYTLSNFFSNLSLKSGKLKISHFKANVLGGAISGSGNLNYQGNWNKTVKVSNIPFEKLAANMMSDVALTGNTNGSISLKSNGKSMHDWMYRLSGGGNFAINDGVIKGFSLPKLFRKAIGLKTPQDVSANANEKTNFTTIKTAFSVDKGVMRLREGALRSDRLKADASGTVSLAVRKLNLTLTPELIPQVELKEGEEAQPASGLMVPVKVRGAFDNVKVTTDYSQTIGNLLKDPKNIEKTLKNFKTEGKAIEDSFEPSKKVIKENWKDLKDNKNPDAFRNILNELDKNGLKLF